MVNSTIEDLALRVAQASVLEPYVRLGRYAKHGERVVNGQRLISTAQSYASSRR